MNISILIDLIKNRYNSKIIIQPHDFPDYDALASSFGLKKYLQNFGIKSLIYFDGFLSQFINEEFLEYLDIPYTKNIYVESNFESFNAVVTVDTMPENTNITKINGKEYIGFIDHHIHNTKDKDYHFEIYEKSAAVSSIIIELYKNNPGIEISDNVANSLAIGLLTDTNSLSRGVEKNDLLNYYYLFNKIDTEYVNYIVRNKISVDDLSYYYRAIKSLKMFGEIGLIIIDKVSNRNIVGIIGDFFISLKELSVIIMVNRMDAGTYISIRSEDDRYKANSLIKYIVKDIGQGGGHTYMAAGYTDKKLQYDFFKKVIGDVKNNFKQ